MTFVKKVTKNQLFLPLFSMVLVMLVNIIYDVANGNPAFNFFSISINNGILYGRLIDILNRGSEAAILALGMTLVVSSSAGTDISVGSVMSLAGGVCCVLLAGFGNVNVATLILFSAGRAIGLLLCNSNIVYINVESFKFFGGYCWIFPTPILITVLCIVVTALVLKFTALGTYVQAVGINKEAARISGYKSAAIIFICYVVCGLFAGSTRWACPRRRPRCSRPSS